MTDPNRSLPVTIADGIRKYVWGQGLAYNVAGSTLEVYHADRLGSIRLLTDAAGSVTAATRFDEWGIPTASTGSSTQPFRFTGEPTDASGLDYLRARSYDPTLGRFLTRDSWAGSPAACQTLNRYAYALNDPTTRVDPSGRKSQAVDVGQMVVKCANAGIQLTLEGLTFGSFGVFLAGAVGGGEATGPGEFFLAGGAFVTGATAVSNWSYTTQSVGYCLGLRSKPDASGFSIPDIPSPIFPGGGPIVLPIP